MRSFSELRKAWRRLLCCRPRLPLAPGDDASRTPPDCFPSSAGRCGIFDEGLGAPQGSKMSIGGGSGVVAQAGAIAGGAGDPAGAIATWPRRFDHRLSQQR